jgi:Ca2+ transporting ATPase
MENAFAKPIDEVLGTLNVNPATGLTDEQVSRLQAKYGKNGMPSSSPVPPGSQVALMVHG